MENIRDIHAQKERRHQNLSMCVEIAFIGVETGQVSTMTTCLSLVRRTPWGKAESLRCLRAAIEQSGLHRLMTAATIWADGAQRACKSRSVVV